MKARAAIKRLGVAFGLSLPFVGIFLLFTEYFLRNNLQLLTGNFPCLTFNPREGATFLPGCATGENSPQGELPFRTNEDGFRDRPRAFFASGAIAFVGDSHVEGLYLREEETMGRLLEASLPPPRVPFLNLGVRGSGPTLQAIRLFRAQKNYPLKGVVWMLNPTDSFDEIYFYHENPGYELDVKNQALLRPHVGRASLWRGLYAVSAALRHRLLTLAFILDHFQLERQFARVIEDNRFSEKPHCNAIFKVASELHGKDIPLIFVSFPHGAKGAGRTYFGVEPRLDEFDRLLACARATGSPVVDAFRTFDSQSSLFWPKDWHLDPHGVRVFVDFLAPQLAAAFEQERRRIAAKAGPR